MNENIIRIENAKKTYGRNTVLNEINACFQQGLIHGVIGRNGSGKTMLFKTICGFVPLTSGKIIVGNQIVGKDIDIPSNMGIIIEAPGFLSNYSGYNNLKLLSRIRNKITRQEIEHGMIRVGLDPKDKKRVGKYSLGMRQRLGIAQAIMEKPEILLLDEPMNGLDKHGIEDFRELFLQLRAEGTTIMLASHNADDIRYLCDTVYEMENGELTQIE